MFLNPHPFFDCLSPSEWIEEIERLRVRLKQFGIDEERVGMELEFAIHPQIATPFCVDQKASFIADLEKQMQQASDSHEAASIADKMLQLRYFTPGEVLMYDLIEKNPATKNMLEYVFGNGTVGRGYYDSDNIFEMRIAHTSPAELSHNHTVFINELHRKLQEYGMELEYPPSRHISFSFWKDDQNLVDAVNPDHVRLGGQIAEGINKAFYDGVLLWRRKPANIDICTGATRTHVIRMAKGRFEIRLPVDDKQYQHPEAVMALTLAGALHGLTAHRLRKDVKSMMPAHPVSRRFYRQFGSDMPSMVHLYNTSIRRGSNGPYEVSEEYLSKNLPYLCAELGLVSNSNDLVTLIAVLQKDMRFLFSPSESVVDTLEKKVKAIMQSARPDKDRIIFTHKEARPLGILSQEKEVDSFQIDPGYTIRLMPMPATGIAYLQQSKLLQKMFSPEFYERLCAAAQTHFGNPGEEERQEAIREYRSQVRFAGVMRRYYQSLTTGQTKG